jgi:hypothetical protein
MSRMTISVLVCAGVVVSTAWADLEQTQSYGVGMANLAVVFGSMGAAGQTQGAFAANQQAVGAAGQTQIGIFGQTGAAWGCHSLSGSVQGVLAGAGQQQTAGQNGMTQSQSQGLLIGQVVGKAGGPGGATGADLACMFQGQNVGASAQQGSGITAKQDGTVEGGPGSIGVVGGVIIAGTSQTQTVTP